LVTAEGPATYCVSKFVLFHKVWELERFQTVEVTLQGHSRVLAVVPFDRPHTISY